MSVLNAGFLFSWAYLVDFSEVKRCPWQAPCPEIQQHSRYHVCVVETPFVPWFIAFDSLESGAIYSVSLMILLVLYCRKTNAQVREIRVPDL